MQYDFHPDDERDFDDFDDDSFDDGAEELSEFEEAMQNCAMLPDGSCMDAGSEHCDFDCPLRGSLAQAHRPDGRAGKASGYASPACNAISRKVLPSRLSERIDRKSTRLNS